LLDTVDQNDYFDDVQVSDDEDIWIINVASFLNATYLLYTAYRYGYRYVAHSTCACGNAEMVLNQGRGMHRCSMRACNKEKSMLTDTSFAQGDYFPNLKIA
jgi:hypothetical protein